MRAVQFTSELGRILALPRRVWSPADAQSLAHDLSQVLGDGSVSLRPIQAIALVELAQCRGLFAPIRVGGGKTLVSLLAARMVGAERPLLLVPANLVDKTEREARTLRLHWDVPELVRVMSYEILGRVQAAEALDRYAPDLVFADECHRLKHANRAVTRRVMRYLKAHPEVVFAAASGTITTRSILDYAHLVGRALGLGSPLPLSRNQREEWSAALDGDGEVGVGELVRLL